MDKIKNLFVFASGVAIGAVVTWKLLESKYAQLAQEEIDSVKEVYGKRYSEPTETTEEDARAKADEAKEKPSIVEYASILQKTGYTDYSAISEKEKKKEEVATEAESVVDRPYVIPPEEFGEFDDYGQISLTYYSDGVLTDDNNDIIEDVEEVVGIDTLNHIGEYEDDAVHVRNDRLKCDYEILQSLEKYSDD